MIQILPNFIFENGKLIQIRIFCIKKIKFTTINSKLNQKGRFLNRESFPSITEGYRKRGMDNKNSRKIRQKNKKRFIKQKEKELKDYIRKKK